MLRRKMNIDLSQAPKPKMVNDPRDLLTLDQVKIQGRSEFMRRFICKERNIGTSENA